MTDPTTVYHIRDERGNSDSTTDPHAAERLSRAGLTVTARTQRSTVDL